MFGPLGPVLLAAGLGSQAALTGPLAGVLAGGAGGPLTSLLPMTKTGGALTGAVAPSFLGSNISQLLGSGGPIQSGLNIIGGAQSLLGGGSSGRSSSRLNRRYTKAAIADLKEQTKRRKMWRKMNQRVLGM